MLGEKKENTQEQPTIPRGPRANSVKRQPRLLLAPCEDETVSFGTLCLRSYNIAMKWNLLWRRFWRRRHLSSSTNEKFKRGPKYQQSAYFVLIMFRYIVTFTQHKGENFAHAKIWLPGTNNLFLLTSSSFSAKTQRFCQNIRKHRFQMLSSLVYNALS